MALTAKAVTSVLLSEPVKKGARNLLIGIVVLLVLSLSICGGAYQYSVASEVAKWFRPTLTEEYFPNLSENSETLDSRLLYATYIQLFYEEDHYKDEKARNEIIDKLVFCFFEKVEETETVEYEVDIETKDKNGKETTKKETRTKEITVERYKVIVSTDTIFAKVEKAFGITITEDERIKIFKLKESLVTLAGFGNGSDFVDFALQFVGENHSRFTSYSSPNGSGSQTEWCAMFVSYCTDNMGYIDQGIIHWFVGCTQEGIVRLRNEGKFEEGAGFGGTYQPQPGDIIFFNWEGVNSYSAHVGIVTSVDGDTINTVEGNTSAKYWQNSEVAEKSYSYTSNVIVGYFPLSQHITSSSSSAGGSNGSWSVRTVSPNANDSAYSLPVNPFPSMFDHGANAGNCTAYAYGRVYETQGINLNINGNAGDWWYYSSSNSKHSQVASAGAVLCWSDGGAGHVAFVEKVNGDGSLVISESGYYSFRWRKRTVTKTDGYGWGGSYTFQGFIVPQK